MHLHEGPDTGHTSDRIEKRIKPSSQRESNPGPFNPSSDVLPLELPPRPLSFKGAEEREWSEKV